MGNWLTWTDSDLEEIAEEIKEKDEEIARLRNRLAKAQKALTNISHELEETGLSEDGRELRISIDNCVELVTKVLEEIDDSL